MTYFVTACAHMHQNLFQGRDVAELMIATIFRYRDAGEFHLCEYVVMPDHIHLLLSLDDGRPLSRAMQLIKVAFRTRFGNLGSPCLRSGSLDITTGERETWTSAHNLLSISGRTQCEGV